MARSISAFVPGEPGSNDLRMTDRGDLEIVTGQEDVRQRVIARLRFQLAQWYLRVLEGVPYRPEIFTRNTSAGLAAAVVTNQILSVDGVEDVQEVVVSIDPITRVMSYSALIMGESAEISVSEQLGATVG